jgi:hypothetical protein
MKSAIGGAWRWPEVDDRGAKVPVGGYQGSGDDANDDCDVARDHV